MKITYLFSLFGLFFLPLIVFAQNPTCQDLLNHCIKKTETFYKDSVENCINDDAITLWGGVCALHGHKVGSSKWYDCVDNETKNCKNIAHNDYRMGTDFCWESYNYCKEKREKPSAKKFPEKLTVIISANCQWETGANTNIHDYNSYSYSVQGVVKVKERKKDFLRYESKTLNVVYNYKSIGLMKHRNDKCYGKIVKKGSGNDNSFANFILDIYLGEKWRKLPLVGEDSYSLFVNFGGNVLLEGIENTCELTSKKDSVMPFGFTTIPNQNLFSTAMAGIKKAGEPGFPCPGNGYVIWQFK